MRLWYEGHFRSNVNVIILAYYRLFTSKAVIPPEKSALGRLNRTQFDDAQFTHARPHMLM